MRRTYKSKKETGLDPRDVKQIVDAKSSVFDAFYIENIKQAKRELSCLGVSNQFAASNRVRKKKYVKRLKEPEIIRESTSRSTYLTPDKSLRVNKPEDLFDQLLRSSPPKNSPIFKCDLKDNEQKKNKKYYRKRKQKIIKKVNYSSSDTSDSSKENIDFNQSDIKSYKLHIEKELNSSKSCNDSIEDIDGNLSMFNNPDFEKDKLLSFTPNRKISQLRSSEVGTSPFCSTPFHEKYRGKSIYKYSPITINSNHNLTNIIENRTSDVYENIEQNNRSTPVRHVSKEINAAVDGLKHLKSDDPCIAVIDFSKNDSNVTKSKEGEIIATNSLETSQPQDASVLQVSENDKFLGFSNVNKTAEMEVLNKYKEINDQLTMNCSMTYTDDELPSEPFLGFSNDKQNIENEMETITSNSDLDNTQKAESGSLYDTCSENESIENNTVTNKEPIVKIQRLSQSILEKYLNKNQKSDAEFDFNDSISTDNYASFTSDTTNKSSEINEDRDSFDSSPENCTVSENRDSETFTDSDDTKDVTVNFVTTRRRNEMTNDSFFFTLDNSISCINNLGVDDEATIADKKEPEDTGNVISTISEKDNTITETLSSNDDEPGASNTITRRTKVPQSPRSSITVRKSNRPDTSCRPSITTRQSIRLTSNMSLNTSEIKHPIVLQPGKKWQRSLSIYRRMTTMVDGTDYSMLDIEPLENKGRKYRQSVIATIELQDLNASLHNESIKSRRSTFVSKPIRSTIKLDSNESRSSVCSSAAFDDSKGYLSEDCDDTVVDLSKLSLGDSEDEDVTVLDNFHETTSRPSTASAARDYVLRRCNQTDALLFDECYPDTALKNCRKIGEGVYGEVYLWRAGDGRARVLKVIPVDGDTVVNGEKQKDYGQIVSEIVIAMELSALGAPIPDIESHLNEGKNVETLDLHSVENATDVFNKVLAARLVYGPYPARLLDLWELYDETTGSENDSPAALPPQQHYLVLELANAGQDLEGYQFNNAEQAYALYKQIAFALAVAEEGLEFEHRDLHWGNVLIAPTDQKYVTFVLRGRAHRVLSCGVRATIIDYSLSRARMRSTAAPLYCDLADDEALFDALGDYQFEVYRLMRERLGNDWKNYDPFTNILWLHYTADKMITALRYTRTNTKIHKHYIAKLKDVKNRILQYGSAAEFVITDNEI
ncbi:dentin sialophosphoprotein [Colias croceus]|uniref:dentin sialophosphoprotein n=1 Tax=Colias crocea TaxID=72248 RepID=UPI001E279DA8|nr:dentin sialophosphoprotein [Colias croceus]